MAIELTPGIQRRIKILFPERHWAEAAQLLSEQCSDNLPAADKIGVAEIERIQCAVLKNCQGILERLPAAIATAQFDWRDALLEAGFAWDVSAHLDWLPGT